MKSINNNNVVIVYRNVLNMYKGWDGAIYIGRDGKNHVVNLKGVYLKIADNNIKEAVRCEGCGIIEDAKKITHSEQDVLICEKCVENQPRTMYGILNKS